MAWRWWQKNVEQGWLGNALLAAAGPMGWGYLAYRGVKGLTELLDIPTPETNSPTYTWDSPQNLPAYDRPVPVVYGCATTGGLTLYQGGDDLLRDVFVAVSEGTVARIDDVRLNGVAWELLKGSSGDGALVNTYLGTASQAVDARFASWRHQTAYGGTAWNFKTGDVTPAVGTFTVYEDNAYVLVKVGLLYVLDLPDGKQVEFTLEWKPTSSGTWTDGGTYLVRFDRYQNGLEEVRVPLFTTGDTEQVTLPFTFNYTEATRRCDIEIRQEVGGNYRKLEAATVHRFTAGTYDLRLSYHDREFDGSPAEREIDGQLLLASADVVETKGGQGYRHTAYVAATVPASDLAQGQASVTARVAGRDTVAVWTGAAWANRWTNNPVWIARDLWLNARYGAGQAAFDDPRAKLAAAYCDEALGTLATATVDSGGGTTALHYSALTYEAGDDVPDDLTGYLVDNQDDERRLVLWHDRTGQLLYVDRAFDVAATSAVIQEQRFRFDYVFDSQADAEEQIRRIATHCRGVVWRDGGTLSFDIERARNRSAFQSGVDVITPDLVLEGSFAAERTSGREVPSGLAVKFLDPDQDDPKQSELLGDGSGRVEEVELYGCVNPRQARRVGAYLWNAARALWRCNLRTSLATCALEPGDRVGVAHPVTGWGYDVAPVLSLTDLAAAEDSTTVTSVAGGFTAALVGHDLVISSGTNFVAGRYRIVSRTSSNQVAVDRAPATAGNGTGGVGTVGGVDDPLRNTSTEAEFVVVSVQDNGDDTRDYALRQYDAALYSDTADRYTTPRPGSPFQNPFSPPAPMSAIRAGFLGDTTPDGVWTPEIQVGWSHPQADGIGTVEVYWSRDGVAFLLAGVYPFDSSPRIALAGFVGTATVAAVPVSVAGVRGVFTAAPTATVTVAGDTVAPAAPVHFETAIDGLVLKVRWDGATEADWSHYLVSVDDWATTRRIQRPAFDLNLPSARSTVVRVKSVDLSGNASSEASTVLFLATPAAPSTSDLTVTARYNQVAVSVSDNHTKTLGHTGFLFRWTIDAGTNWNYPTPFPVERASFTVPLTSFSGASLTLGVQVAEADIFGASSWSSSKTSTIYKQAIDDGVTISTDAAGTAGIQSAGFAAPGDDSTTPGTGWKIGKDAAEFYGGAAGFKAALGGPLWTSDGSYGVGLGWALTATGKGKKYPLLTSTNFSFDGQSHWYKWVTNAWVELNSIGLAADGDDYYVQVCTAPSGYFAFLAETVDKPAVTGRADNAEAVFASNSHTTPTGWFFNAGGATAGPGVQAVSQGTLDIQAQLAAITGQGGFAIQLTANEDLYQGEVVVPDRAGANDDVVKCPTTGDAKDMPIGVVLADAANGDPVWIVVAGIALVLPESGVTATRGYVLVTSTSTAGRAAQSSGAPVSDHWRELGHWLDTGTGNGVLTRAVLHFN